jgi:YesN/AraC family two-component response regulator
MITHNNFGDTMSEELEINQETESILIVDDDLLLLETLTDYLTESGYTVINAIDGKDGLEKYKQFADSIDLVISDIVMPRKDGVSLYKDVKIINPNINFIFMSGFTPENLEGNGVFFIKKPFSSADLLSLIRETGDKYLLNQ